MAAAGNNPRPRGRMRTRAPPRAWAEKSEPTPRPQPPRPEVRHAHAHVVDHTSVTSHMWRGFGNRVICAHSLIKICLCNDLWVFTRACHSRDILNFSRCMYAEALKYRYGTTTLACTMYPVNRLVNLATQMPTCNQTMELQASSASSLASSAQGKSQSYR